ncbi:hypothetical protein RRG08_015039 [Elysia crispata]|uniref:Uncharacterized protein n=1 Tax=Elysia crispata TaxID=231223 RepID=A0AAE1EA78_9GAST|nr:hypothetical protein RRG08_015039 [Elysia crispata]
MPRRPGVQYLVDIWYPLRRQGNQSTLVEHATSSDDSLCLRPVMAGATETWLALRPRVKARVAPANG